MKPESIFSALCAQPALTPAVADLTALELAVLIGWLRTGHGRGIQGLVLGLAEVEAAGRFLSSHHP